jgi:UMF1 family MFS transporter
MDTEPARPLLERPTRAPLLERLVLHRPETRAWAIYDWANSAMYTVIIASVFPVFFRSIAAEGLDDHQKTAVFARATTMSLIVIACLSPVLGAVADYARAKKKLFAVFLGVGVVANAAMFFIAPGDWRLACWLFGLVNVGAAGSFVFYDAMLSSVAKPNEMDRLSTTAYAVGYLGGGLCLVLCLALIKKPGWFGLAADQPGLAMRIGFLVVAVWWLVFTIPFFRDVPEPEISIERDERVGLNPFRVAFGRMFETLRELRTYRHAFVLLLAYFAYSDGIGTIIRMATLVGDERGIAPEVLIACVLLAQFAAIPFAILFGKLAGVIGPKRAILIAIGVYVVITLMGYRLRTPTDFIVLTLLVASVQGGAQALSRSLFASFVPPHKSGEFFGLFSTFDKFAGIAGPAVFMFTRSTGTAILLMIPFFVVGAALLWTVDVDAGRRAARDAEKRLTQ